MTTIVSTNPSTKHTIVGNTALILAVNFQKGTVQAGPSTTVKVSVTCAPAADLTTEMTSPGAVPWWELGGTGNGTLASGAVGKIDFPVTGIKLESVAGGTVSIAKL